MWHQRTLLICSCVLLFLCWQQLRRLGNTLYLMRRSNRVWHLNEPLPVSTVDYSRYVLIEGVTSVRALHALPLRRCLLMLLPL